MTIKEVPMVEKKKLIASGASVMLVVPKQWLEENGLNKGDEVLMVANGDLTFKKITKENVDKIRNQLSDHNLVGSPAVVQESKIST